MRPIHLCGFLIAGPVSHSHALWRNPAHNVDFLDLDFYLHIARTLERGKFDFVFFADRLGIADRYGLNLEVGIRYGDQDATRLDPVPILGAMAAVTRYSDSEQRAPRPTISRITSRVSLRPSIISSGGRAAWNVVTSMNDSEALNFGLEAHLEHDQRYDRADEFVELTYKLWRSWDSDALILDKAHGLYADPSRVRYVNHTGRWFRSRGPLNIRPCPRRVQSSSRRGRRGAARRLPRAGPM